MKSYAFLVLLLIAFTPPLAFGLAEEISYGLFFGPTIATADVTIASSTEGLRNRYGYGVGSFVEFPWLNWLFIRPEFTAVQKGYSDSLGNTVRLDYIEVPILLQPKLYFRGGSVFLLGGLSIGMLLKQDSEDSNGNTSRFNGEPFGKNELTAVGGVGLEVNFRRDWGMFINARYSQGLTNGLVESLSGFSGSYKSRSIFVFAGVFFTDLDVLDPNESRARDFLERQKTRND